MQILCRPGTLVKFVLVAWFAGALTGFWAGRHVVTAPEEPLAAASAISGTAGTEWREEVNTNGDPHARHRAGAQLAARAARLTAGAPRLAPQSLLPPHVPVTRTLQSLTVK